MALGQPLDPSTWDVSIPELNLHHRSRVGLRCRTHELFSRLKSKKKKNIIIKKQQQQTNKQDKQDKQDKKAPAELGYLFQ